MFIPKYQTFFKHFLTPWGSHSISNAASKYNKNKLNFRTHYPFSEHKNNWLNTEICCFFIQNKPQAIPTVNFRSSCFPFLWVNPKKNNQLFTSVSMKGNPSNFHMLYSRVPSNGLYIFFLRKEPFLLVLYAACVHKSNPLSLPLISQSRGDNNPMARFVSFLSRFSS